MQREWAHAHPEGSTSGITWTELFVFFDTAGYRISDGQHVKDGEAVRRAKERREKAKVVGLKTNKSGNRVENTERPWNILQSIAVTEPTYDQELKLVKAIVRQIARHEIDDEQKKWFQMETRAKLRSLAMLGVTGKSNCTCRRMQN